MIFTAIRVATGSAARSTSNRAGCDPSCTVTLTSKNHASRAPSMPIPDRMLGVLNAKYHPSRTGGTRERTGHECKCVYLEGLNVSIDACALLVVS